MHKKETLPLHLNGDKRDFEGNAGIGRYVILCGSQERARQIGQSFDQLETKSHPRGHDLYLGTIPHKDHAIEMAAISTGIGCPSTDIILNELIYLGAKRFLRIGTAGSLQPQWVKTGDVVIATGAVRDEYTSRCYVDISYPALASLSMINAAVAAAKALDLETRTHTGIVHTKDSLYAREFGVSHLKENAEYMQHLKDIGVLASEMESAIIFTLAHLHGYRNSKQYREPAKRIKAGSILAIVGDETPVDNNQERINKAIQRALALGIQTIKFLYESEITANDF
ncbi:nucleoside phosphorylase [Coxiella burnetii]|uniref:nucleoside phosphorylase n=1 Tax=Coxiella burnetii TaxID=777 RepID=UPI000183CF42|nr:nucleoside phosphorylase [Coxiella burnetii]ACJ18592.1 uridine phosphorylase [Coxiella burnetii CbuG_Q212]ATN66971.1 uridine phosphorylase [Coxiella burnetii]OYK86295.1 uridine phosphorylase [Coxiella burnetii]